MPTGRREIYHYDPADEGASVSVVVCDDDDHRIVGLLVDLTPEGIGARFFPPHAPRLSLGEEMDITLSSPELKATATTRVQVIEREDGPQNRDYQLLFLDPEYVESQLLQLKGLFNRRNAYRVKPTLDLPAKAVVALEPGQPPVKAYVRDVSMTGICLALPRELELHRRADVQAAVALSLPGLESPLGLRAEIRFRRLDGDAVVYGMEFVRQTTPEFAKIEDRIAAYVMSVQRAEVARSRNRERYIGSGPPKRKAQ